MRRALANLLDNAIKYHGPQAEVRLQAFCDEKFCIFKVIDNGIVIPQEDLSKIYTRLFRGDKSRSKKGLGLGLTLVKAIIEAHFGHIEVNSTPGQGSEFSLYIPNPT